MHFNVTVIPTLMLFRNGEEDGKVIGFVQKEEIVKLF